MSYFSLYPFCYLLKGARNYAIYDILQKRVFWIREQFEISFLELSEQGKDIESISEILGEDADKPYVFAEFLNSSDLGALYDCPKASVKYRPFIDSFLEEKNGYFQPVNIITLEVSGQCDVSCLYCRPETRIANLECACGCYSDSGGITYDLDNLLYSLQYAKPAMIELAGGDLYMKRSTVEKVLKQSKQYHIPVKVKTPGNRLTEEDIHLLKETDGILSLTLINFTPYNGTPGVVLLTQIIRWALKYEYKNISIVLLYDEESFDLINDAKEWCEACHLQVETICVRFSIKNNNRNRFKPFSVGGHYDFAIGYEQLARKQKGHFCWQDRLCVMANGEVRPCIGKDDIIFGNVHFEDILDIIRKSRLHPAPKDKKSHYHPCDSCEFSLGCSTCAVSDEKVHLGNHSKAWNCFYNPLSGAFKNEMSDL